MSKTPSKVENDQEEVGCCPALGEGDVGKPSLFSYLQFQMLQGWVGAFGGSVGGRGPGALAVSHLGFGWRQDCCPEQEEEPGQVPQLGVQRSPTGMGEKGWGSPSNCPLHFTG